MSKNRTLKQLNEDIKTEMQLDPGLISDAERMRFINQAINDIGDLGLFEKEIDLPVEDGEAELPEDFLSPVCVRWQDGRILRPVPFVSAQSHSHNPVGFSIVGNALRTYPLSTGTCKVLYNYRPQDVLNDDDVPDIPSGWDRLLVDHAVALAHRKNGNIQLFREYMQYYEMRKTSLITELLRKQNSRTNEVYNQEYAINPSTPFDYL